MPQQQALPTWLSLNAVNAASQSGQTDPITGFPYAGGGLNQGDYFDLTSDEALSASYPATGILFQGRYRYVQVDSGATAANVKTGTIGFARSGSTVRSVITTNVGSGLTNGSYQIAATPLSGGGSGAIISVTVAGNVIVGNPTVVNGGFGYVSAPSFSLTALGGSAATVVALLNGPSMNVVTSADLGIGTASAANAGIGPIHPVVFLNAITPGNYGFVQELGTASIIAGTGNTQQAGQYAIAVNGASANGTLAASSASYGIYTVGNIVDPVTSPLAGTLVKVILDSSVVQD